MSKEKRIRKVPLKKSEQARAARRIVIPKKPPKKKE